MAKVTVSMWYNYSLENPDAPAIPEAPELGRAPHAEEAMRHYGITYRQALPRPISDSWMFLGCENVPADPPKWMRVFPDNPEDRGDVY